MKLQKIFFNSAEQPVFGLLERISLGAFIVLSVVFTLG